MEANFPISSDFSIGFHKSDFSVWIALMIKIPFHK